ncbi:major facilitator superfamily transporter sugar [Grosmannia clavigera kw1407]|uniref:Major facilitator superfamily transporter sugar n=1 Tax=Grosmannia clavigera (strain kw1407 / UAMH 11150) TaxID=655863 RepID=F0XKZ2_GROCL|nr:major facilitator superfamily transporter sugar [Grosmannia clavigera kw1407]EFX01724.1 major facilitator superfamily transporter sugar [Grosmannia clavigera kw1407]
MSSWYSNILTTTTSRISNLRSLLGGEADGDTEDDTHVCRVLRAYYIETARSFPQWLPPDPKAPPPVVATPPPGYGQPPIGSRYGAGLAANGSTPAGGLSSLWDNNNNGSASAPPTASLRQPRLSPAAGQDHSLNSRPLPSQRLGSYQSTQSAPANTGSAQGKLRNLFGGGAGASPASSRTNSPAPMQGGGGLGGPPSHGQNARYNAAGSAGGNAPWASNDHQVGQPGGRRRPVGTGLPSGPRMR